MPKNQGITYYGEVVLARFDLLREMVFTNCRFRGPVNLRGSTCHSRVKFVNCVLENRLIIEDADMRGGLSIESSTIISPPNTEGIEGLRVRARHISIKDSSIAGGINLSHASIEKDVEIKGTLIDGDVCMERNRIEGGIDLSAQNKSLPSVQNKSLPFYIAGEANFQYANARYFLMVGGCVKKDLNLDYTSFEQYIRIASAELEEGHSLVKIGCNLKCYGTRVKNNYIAFQGIDVTEDVILKYGKVGTGLFIENTVNAPIGNKIGGSLILEGFEAPKFALLEGVHISGQIKATATKIGDLMLVPAIALKPSTVNGKAKGQDAQKSEIQYELEVQYVEIGGDIIFTHSIISGRAWFTGVKAHTNFANGGKGSPANKTLDLRNVTVEGSMRFADFEKEQENILKKIIDSQITSKKSDLKKNLNTDSMINQFPFGIDLSTSKIGGDLDISNVHCEKGIIDISDSNIEQNIKILPRKDTDTPTRSTIACSLKANSITCGGNFNLAGLRLERPKKGQCKENDCVGAEACAEKIRPESVVVHNATINGVLRTRERPDGDSEQKYTFAKIPGELSLEATHIGCLVISNDSFPIPDEKEDTCVYHLEKLPDITFPENLKNKIRYETDYYLTYEGVMTDEEKKALLTLSKDDEYLKAINYLFKRSQDKEKNAIILRQSYIGTMRVYFGKEDKDKRFPRPVDLQFADIKYWDFKDRNNLNDKGDESEIASNYIAFLKNSKKISIHTYRAVENTLFNQGNERAADDIHKALKERLCREGNILVKSGGLVWGFLTGHGTSAFRPFFLVLLWLAFSTFLFSNPYAISPSEEGLSATNTKLDENSHPLPNTWNRLDGFMVAIRYHIPIANLDPRNEWEPTNKTPINWPNWLTPLAPEDYALFVAIVHWALIPIIVFIFSKQILRQRGVG